MFTIEELKEDVTLLLDLKDDVRTECAKLGTVTSVKIYDKNPEGVMSVKYADPESALLCIKKMDGRFFGGQKISAYLWDGKEKFEEKPLYNLDDEDDEEEERIENFSKWIEQEKE
jgi:HIV Tat-specific factor 1